MANCEKCGVEIAEGATLCETCATPEPAVVPEAPVMQTEEPKEQEPKKKKSKKGIIIAIIALLLVGAIVAGVLLLGGKKSDEPNCTMYIKDGSLYFTSIDEIAPIKIADEVIEESDGFFAELMEKTGLSGPVTANYTKLLSDKKTLIYPKKVSVDDAGVNLFYKDIMAEEPQETKIDSEIRNFQVSNDDKIITYTKGDDAESFAVYRYFMDTKEKEKVVENVSSVDISDDGTKIMYVNDEDSLYLYDSTREGDKKEKIDSDVESVCYYNDDFSKVYYLKEEALYEKVNGSEKKKLASDVEQVIKVYETGEAYYLKLEEEEIPYADLFTDDMKEKDDKVKENDDVYDNSSWNTYKDWYEKNHEAVRRKSFRKAIKDQHINKKIYSLYYVNGEGSKEIAENVSKDQFDFTYAYASDTPVLVFNTINEETMSKFKLSQIEFGTAKYNERRDEWEYSIEPVEYWTKFKETVEKNYLDAQKLQVAVGATVTDIEEDRAWDITVAKDGSAIYYIDNIEVEKKDKDEKRDYDAEWTEDVYYYEDGKLYLNQHLWGDDFDDSFEGEAFKISIAEGVVNRPEPVDSDVSLYGIRLEENGTSLTYFKNYDSEENTGDYFVNGKEIAYDVKGSTVTFVSEKEIYYLAEYDAEAMTGILKSYDGEESAIVANDVYYYELSPAGDMLFISDYSVKNNYGTLYKVGKEENILIDYDVTGVVSFSDKARENAFARFYAMMSDIQATED